MAFKLSCAETGADCPFEVTTETREELMEHVKVHAKASHPEMASKPPDPKTFEKLIHVV